MDYSIGDTISLDGTKALFVSSSSFKSSSVGSYLLPFYYPHNINSRKCFTDGSSFKNHNRSKVILIEKSIPFFNRFLI